jgi:hypothetical protein
MSYNKQNNSLSGKKPFCKVCHDAGKPESEYTSHFVKSLPDRYGKTTVTCPTLNSTECRYCYKLGHTAKFCPVIERNKKMEKKEHYRTKKVDKQEVAVEKKNCGAFSALADDSDQEDQSLIIAEPKDEFPVLFVKKEITSNVRQSAVSWATIAEKPAAPVYKPIAPEHKPVEQSFKRLITKSWADYSDSDEDDYEFEYATTYKSEPVAESQIDSDDDW